MIEFEARRSAFRKLHESGCFVIPNPWDAGSAKYLRHLGFKALATTSAGLAYSEGLIDSAQSLTRDIVLRNVAEIVQATDLPVNADFQEGYATTPDGVAKSVRLCVETGVAGLSIEDATGRKDKPLFEISEAVERLRAAREAIDRSGADVLLTARAECFIAGHPSPLDEAIKRLQAYSAAGADVLYAPGPQDRETLKVLVDAVSPKPMNVLMYTNAGLTVADVAELGARRISVGSALAKAAWTAFMNTAERIARDGSFEGFGGMRTTSEIFSAFSAR